MKPPIVPRALLSMLLREPIREALAGDLAEGFNARVAQHGRWRASRWYWSQALRSIAARWSPAAPLASRSWSGGVWKDLRYGARTLRRAPGFSARRDRNARPRHRRDDGRLQRAGRGAAAPASVRRAGPPGRDRASGRRHGISHEPRFPDRSATGAPARRRSRTPPRCGPGWPRSQQARLKPGTGVRAGARARRSRVVELLQAARRCAGDRA